MFNNPSARYYQVKERKATKRHVKDIKIFQKKKILKNRRYDCEIYRTLSENEIKN